VEYRLPSGEVAFYEGALLDLFQKYPPTSSLVSVTIHEAGKGGGAFTVHHAWPRDSRSAVEIAEFIARNIWEPYTAHAGQAFDGVTIEFSTSG
jgi:hypothetical protein